MGVKGCIRGAGSARHPRPSSYLASGGWGRLGPVGRISRCIGLVRGLGLGRRGDYGL